MHLQPMCCDDCQGPSRTVCCALTASLPCNTTSTEDNLGLTAQVYHIDAQLSLVVQGACVPGRPHTVGCVLSLHRVWLLFVLWDCTFGLTSA